MATLTKKSFTFQEGAATVDIALLSVFPNLIVLKISTARLLGGLVHQAPLFDTDPSRKTAVLAFTTTFFAILAYR